jgi:hypothetical protein
MELKDFTKKWLIDEIKDQNKKIAALEEANRRGAIGFKELIDMRKQFLEIAQTKLKILNNGK